MRRTAGRRALLTGSWGSVILEDEDGGILSYSSQGASRTTRAEHLKINALYIHLFLHTNYSVLQNTGSGFCGGWGVAGAAI